MDKYLLLEATEHNWGLMGPGSWNHTDWKNQSDGEYTASMHYNSTEGDWDSNNSRLLAPVSGDGAYAGRRRWR